MTWNDWPGENEADPLEPLLRSAQWPEADRRRMVRLEEQWHAVSASRRRKRWVARVAAVAALAAGVGIAVVAYWLARQPPPRPGGALPVAVHLRQPAPPPQPSPNERPVTATATDTVAYAKLSSPVSRPATELEMWVVRSRTTARRSAGSAVKKEERVSPRATADRVPLASRQCVSRHGRDASGTLVTQSTGDTIDKRIGPIPRNPSADLDRLARAIEIDRDRLQQQMAVWIERLRGPYREPAMRVLREQERGIQEAVSFQLLKDDDPRSLEISLRFVERGGPLAAAALAAASRVPNPPVDRLMACLGSPRMADRLAAAKILGRIDDPRISDWLTHLASQGLPREEVLTALMCRTDEKARNYLAQASTNPILYGSMLAASRRLETPPPLMSVDIQDRQSQL